MSKKCKIVISVLAVIIIAGGVIYSIRIPQQSLPEIGIVTRTMIRPDDKTICSIFLSHGNIQDTLISKIKIRGSFSLKYPKKSFTLKLAQKDSFCGLPADRDFVLQSCFIDKTFMRHKLGYDLFRQMESKNVAAQCTYANLSINGKANGLYAVMQKIDRTMLQLNKNDTMAMLFKDPMMFYQQHFEGYEHNYYEQKYPDFDIYDKTYVIEAFRDFLFHSDDSTFQQQLSQWVDIDNVIDWFLLTYFTNNNDGVMKNFYFYKMDSATPFRFAVWDYDYSFGRDHENRLKMDLKPIDWQFNILLKRMMDFPAYRTPIKNRWFELRQQVFSIENVRRMMDANDEQIHYAVKQNAKIWKINDPFFMDENDYEKEIELIYQYLESYLPHCDDFFRKL